MSRASGRQSWRKLLCCAFLAAVSGFANAETKIVDLPVVVTYSQAEGKANWAASTPDLSQTVPVLNAGDRLRILEVTSVTQELGKWTQTFRRFSHQSCHTSWFRRKCTKYYANDNLTAVKEYDPLSSDVNLQLEFVNAFPPHAPWKRGEFPVSTLQGQWVDALGSLEMKIAGGVSAALPVVADFKPAPGSSKVGEMREGEILGRNGPQQWLTVKVEFEAAQLAK